MTALDAAAGAVLADAGQLGQVLVNLAVNARDAMPGGGTLTVETARAEVDPVAARAHKGLRPGPYATIVVRDTGCGMSAETQARIFEPFFTTKPAGQGTGLGLSTVYGIIKQSDGYIAVASAPGGGTTFTIYLPRVAAAAGAADEVAPPRPRCPAGRHETVLLVDDEATVRRSVRRMLERQGYAVIEAQHGADALLAWSERGGDVDVVLTDVIMPVMGGRELVERLRRAAPAVRVLYMSGYAGDAAATDGILARGEAFMEKPFGVDDLARRIREVLDESRAA